LLKRTKKNRGRPKKKKRQRPRKNREKILKIQGEIAESQKTLKKSMKRDRKNIVERPEKDFMVEGQERGRKISSAPTLRVLAHHPPLQNSS
jgi:hypothetical protein